MKTTAIVPVLNEEKTIVNTLSVLNNSSLIDEIIMVDDASTDASVKKAKRLKLEKLKIISLKKNLGKSGAVKVAARNLQTDILFFCDADLINFREEHINQILSPFSDGKTAMSAGLRDSGFFLGNFFSKNFFPLITGERAMPYLIFKQSSTNPLMEGYGLEVVLNDYCKRNDIPIYKKVMKGLKQTPKPKKWKNGTSLLVKEIFQVIFVIVQLKIKTWQ